MKKIIIVLSAIMLSGIMQAQILKEVTAFSSEITDFSIDEVRSYKTTDAEYLVVLNDLKAQLTTDQSVDLKKEKTILKNELSYLKTQKKNFNAAQKHLAEQKKFYKSEIKNYEKEIKNMEKEQKASLNTVTDPDAARNITVQYEERINRLRANINADNQKLTELNTVETERLKKWQLGIAMYESDLKAKQVRITAYENSVKANLGIIKSEIKATEAAIKGK